MQAISSKICTPCVCAQLRARPQAMTPPQTSVASSSLRCGLNATEATFFTRRCVRGRRASGVRMEMAIGQKSSTTAAKDKLEFGFTPTNEKWLGRLAIFGQFCGTAQGFASGKGMLQQLGMSPTVPVALCVVSVSGSFICVATLLTMLRYISGDMEPHELDRYVDFFNGLPLPNLKWLENGSDLPEVVERGAGGILEASVKQGDELLMNQTLEEKRIESFAQNLIYLPDFEVERLDSVKEARDIATLDAIGARSAMLWFFSSIMIEGFSGVATSDQFTTFFDFLQQ